MHGQTPPKSPKADATAGTAVPGIDCQAEHPDRCSAPIAKGMPAPFSGIITTTALAIALQTSLDEALGQVTEEREYCENIGEIQGSTMHRMLITEQARAQEREARWREALTTSEEDAKRLAAEGTREENEHVLWAAGGIVGGLVVGVTAGVVFTLYGVAYVKAGLGE